jgi:hypothetical protein
MTPQDQSAFWQRQRDLMRGRIEPIDPPTYGITWSYLIVAIGVVCLVFVALSV